MAKLLEYVLEGGDPSTGRRVLIYGKCKKSPYVENQLWFVYVPRVMGKTATFLVSEEYARPKVMDELDIDFEKWSSVAHKVILGTDWNPHEECLWEDMPFHVHSLRDGTPIRYGLSRSQSKRFPERELWYVVVGLGDQKVIDWRNNPHPAFVVDKLCTEPQFMDKMGSDPQRWRLICWDAPVGIEPWYTSIDDDYIPDPYYVLKRNKASRSFWQRIMNGLFPE